MSINLIFLLILFAALCHASWSAIVKNSNNGLAIMAITSIIEIIVFFPLVFTVPFPTIDIWYFIIATTLLHGFYRYSVIISYQYGDLSFVYPIARGGSCLIIGLVSLLLIHSDISYFGIIGILLICFGLFMISFLTTKKFNKSAFIIATTTAVLIATYTLLDGIAVRKTGNAFTFIFWMLLLNGIPMLIYALISKNGLRKKHSYILIDGIIAGVLAILGYGLVVWSMQFIEIAYVSSIREVSIVFATILSVYLLKEKDAKKRIVPSIIIVMGVTLVYFQIG
ncbi:DMT family transporter [Alphaproteobacteria bacterium]|nr:DMT family transporter [Alphaproteobacteria bacterium]